MVDVKLVLLETSFRPDRIRFCIELAPVGEGTFDEPVENAVSKLDAVANYARSTFGVRLASLPEQKAPERPANEIKRIKDGNRRVVEVLEGELARARAGGNEEEIRRAKAHLERARAGMENLKNGENKA